MTASPKQAGASAAMRSSALMQTNEAFGLISDAKAREAEAYTLAVQAVLWGLQWVKGGETFRDQTSPLAAPDRSPYDPTPYAVNVWGHARALPTADFGLIQTANTETLHSRCLLDLCSGPVVVVHPDFGDRYFLTSIRELHGDAHRISQKQDGGHPAPYALVPRGWTGHVPDDVKRIEVRSRYVMLAPRIAVQGDDDLPNVHALQRQLKLIGLENWRKTDTEIGPGEPMRPLRRPDSLTPEELMFFEELGETLKDLTIRDDEVAFARQLETIGITARDGFQVERLDALTMTGMYRGILDGQSIAAHKARSLAAVQRGGTWTMSPDTTNLDSWPQRAGVGLKHTWGELADEVFCPTARVDVNGRPLAGSNRYVLHFPKERLPPARFWRIRAHDLEGLLARCPERRFGTGDSAGELQLDPDGGVTITIQHETPGTGHETNWLPAPPGRFVLAIWLYQSEERLHRGVYVVPPVTMTH